MRLLKELYLKPYNAYMLRDDSLLFECNTIHPYIKYLFNDTDNNQIEFLFNKNYLALKWFFDHTANSDVQEKIIEFVYAVLNNKFFKIDSEKRAYFEKTFLNRVDYELKKKAVFDIVFLFRELNTLTNQEFCRFRTSNLLFSGDSNEIYFRISSINFNWFDLIWSVCYKYKQYISDVTICKDANTFGGRFNPYKVNNKELNHIDIDEFLTEFEVSD